MSEKQNSWAKNIILKLGKRASNSPLTKVGNYLTKGPIKSIKSENKARKEMRDREWVEGTIGFRSYDTIFNKLKKYYKDNDIEGANSYMKEQENKMSGQ